MTKAVIFVNIVSVQYKTKNKKSSNMTLRNVSSQLGILLMSVATTFGMIEINNHVKAQVLVPARAVFASENQIQSPTNSSILRDKEDVAPHYISYSTFQRTPSRSGKH